MFERGHGCGYLSGRIQQGQSTRPCDKMSWRFSKAQSSFLKVGAYCVGRFLLAGHSRARDAKPWAKVPDSSGICIPSAGCLSPPEVTVGSWHDEPCQPT